jgi:hypothetical protein
MLCFSNLYHDKIYQNCSLTIENKFSSIADGTVVSLADFDGYVHVNGISIDGEEEETGLRLSINITVENTDLIDVQLHSFSLYITAGEMISF